MSIMKRIVLGEQCPAITGYPPRSVQLDLNPGDIIRTDYGTGPYRVVEIRPFGDRSSLTLELIVPEPGIATGKHYWINDVQKRSDGRYTSNNGRDELSVVSRATAQLALF